MKPMHKTTRLFATLIVLASTSLAACSDTLVPPPQINNGISVTSMLQRAEAGYQYDASKKRYADIIKIADLLNEYVAKTGHVPQLEPEMAASHPLKDAYEVALLGQDTTIEQQWRDGTRLGFSLSKYRGEELLEVLEAGLGRKLSLPIDPQKYGVQFAPVYYLFFREEQGGQPEHFAVTAYFASPVKFSQQLAEGVHMVAFTNHPEIEFIVPPHAVSELTAAERQQALADGAAADQLFSNWVKVSIP